MSRIMSKKRYGMLVTVCCLFLLMCSLSVAAKSETGREQKRAIKAYTQFLSRKRITWHRSKMHSVHETVNKKTGLKRVKYVHEKVKASANLYRFGLAYVEKGKAPLLIVEPGTDHPCYKKDLGYVNIYRYGKGKVRFVSAEPYFSYFENKGFAGFFMPKSSEHVYFTMRNGQIEEEVIRPAGKEQMSLGHKLTKKNLKKYLK